METSLDFLRGLNPSFVRAIYNMLVSASVLLDAYKRFQVETPPEGQKSPEEFLKENDLLLEMFTKENQCYEDLLWAMKEWAKK